MTPIYRSISRSYRLCMLLLLACVTLAEAQVNQVPTIQWQRLLGPSYGSSPYQPRVIRANSNGYAVLYGKVIRLNDSGGTIWETTLPNPPEYPGYSTLTTHIAATPDGGFGVLAYNRFKWSLFRLNEDGSIRWNKTFTESSDAWSSGTREFAGLIYTADGGFLAISTIGYPRSPYGTELYKFDATGNNTIKGSISYPGGSNPRPTTSATRVVQTMDGNYLLVGDATGTSFTPTDWTAKVDPQLAVISQKKSGGLGLDDVIISPYDNTAAIAVGSTAGTETRGLRITTNGDKTDSITIVNRVSRTKSFVVPGNNPTSHTIADVVNERQGDVRLQTVVGQNLSYLQKLGGSGVETVTGAVAGSDGGILVIGTTTSTDGDVQGKTNTDAVVWLVKVGPISSDVYSVKSGNWNDPGVWSCNCVPASYNNVTVKDPHVVTLDSTMPMAICQNLEIIGTFSMQGGSLSINGTLLTLDGDNLTTK